MVFKDCIPQLRQKSLFELYIIAACNVLISFNHSEDDYFYALVTNTENCRTLYPS